MQKSDDPSWIIAVARLRINVFLHFASVFTVLQITKLHNSLIPQTIIINHFASTTKMNKYSPEATISLEIPISKI